MLWQALRVRLLGSAIAAAARPKAATIPVPPSDTPQEPELSDDDLEHAVGGLERALLDGRPPESNEQEFGL